MTCFSSQGVNLKNRLIFVQIFNQNAYFKLDSGNFQLNFSKAISTEKAFWPQIFHPKVFQNQNNKFDGFELHFSLAMIIFDLCFWLPLPLANPHEWSKEENGDGHSCAKFTIGLCFRRILWMNIPTNIQFF